RAPSCLLACGMENDTRLVPAAFDLCPDRHADIDIARIGADDAAHHADTIRQVNQRHVIRLLRIKPNDRRRIHRAGRARRDPYQLCALATREILARPENVPAAPSTTLYAPNALRQSLQVGGFRTVV